MLSYNEIKEKKTIILDGEPYLVLSSHVFRKQTRKAVNQTKLKHIVSGRVVEKTFHQSDSAEEAEVEEAPIVYIYSRNGDHVFHEAADKSTRFSLSDDLVESSLPYLKNGTEVTALVFNPDDEEPWHEYIVGIELPIKMDFEVTEAPPNVKGNTADGGTKRVTIETGTEVSTPMFVETGDTIRVNTQTGEYVGRV